MRRAAAAAALALLGTAPLRAQTNDHVFRSWRWGWDAASPRAAGLAGAMTAAGDDASAALHNPAGLALMARSEMGAGLLSRRAGRSLHGDVVAPRTGIGFAAAAGRLGRRWTIAGTVSESHARRLRLDAQPLLPGPPETGAMDAVVTELALAAAWRLTPRIHVGGRLGAARLALDGGYAREPEGGPAELRMETSGSATRLRGGLGVVFEPLRRLRLGASTDTGVRWRAQRRAVSPLLGTVLDEGSGYEVRQPRVVSAGLAFDASLKLRLAAQVDHVRLSQIAGGLVIGQGAHARGDYALADAWEPRLALELSLPRRAASVQLRGGVHWAAPASLRYTGADVVERAVFAGARRQAVGAAGASLVTAGLLRIDLAAQFGGERTHLLAGLAARF